MVNLGLAQNALGQTDTAIASLLRAESIAPADARIPYARATILAQQGKNLEALRTLQRVLGINPDHAEGLQLLKALLKQKEPTKTGQAE